MSALPVVVPGSVAGCATSERGAARASSASAALVERGLDRVEQRTHAERDVLNATVHEKAGRSAYAALQAAIDMLTYALQIDLVVHLRGVERHVETELLRIAVQLLRFQVFLVGEQQLVHLPELALRARALGRLCGDQRMRMNVDEREMPVHE